MTKIKEEILKGLNKLKDKGVIDTEKYVFLKKKVEKRNDVTVLEELHRVTSYLVYFYIERFNEGERK